MELLGEAGQILEWGKAIVNIVDIILAPIGLGAVIYGCYRICRRCRDKLHRIDSLFTPSGDRSTLKSNVPSQFLREENQIVDFLGRGEQLERLTNWARSEPSSNENVSIALITGAPGRGKSRLARHLCELAKGWKDRILITRLILYRIRKKEWNGKIWIAGFLRKRPKHTKLTEYADFSFLLEQRRPMLLVIDDAEQRTDQVEKLVTAALAPNRGKYSVRILLIARRTRLKSKDERWWSKLKNTFSDSKQYSTNPFEGVEPVELPPIEDDPEVKDRRQEFRRALGAFREALKPTTRGTFASFSNVLKALWGAFRKAPKKNGEAESEASKDDIPNDLWQAPKVETLDIHLAALLKAYGADIERDAGQTNIKIEEELFEMLVSSEQIAWDQAIGKILPDQDLERGPIRRAIAWLATTDGLTCENDAVDRLLLLPDFDKSTPERQVGVARIAAAIYPGDGEAWWGGVVPDRLTTWLTRELDGIIEDDIAKKPPTVVAGLPLEALDNLLRHLAWRVQRYGNECKQDEHSRALANAIHASGGRGIVAAARVGTEVGDPIGRIAAGVLSETEDEEAAYEVSSFIGSNETVALRELALVAARILYLNAATDSDEEQAKQAQNLSVRLSALGKREEALAASEEVVAIIRKLVEVQPDVFRPNLAGSLNNLSVFLSGLGRHEEALAAIEEAVAIRRNLAKLQPDTFRPNLAGSLDIQSVCLSGLGRREEALAAIEEAVAIRRDLASTRPTKFRPALAASLNNLGARLFSLGHREEALAAIEEAVAIRRGLAAAQPDAFRPDLAASLNNLGVFLSDLGRHEEALAVIEEAVAILRKLAEARPGAFRPSLAASLHNLGARLSGLGRREEALAAIEEAVAIRRGLAAAQPEAFCPDLAGSLNDLSDRLSGLGRREEALAAIEEAVAIRRDLAGARPDAFRPDLAASLNNLSVFLAALGRREEALAAIEEAVPILRDLAAARPDAFRPNLAASLNNLGARLSSFGRQEEALAAIEEAVAIRRDLAGSRPDAFRPDLAESLNNLSVFLSALGRHEEALAAIEEAIHILHDLAAARPDVFRPGLAMSLSNLSARLFGLGRYEEALVAIEEATAINRELAEARPGSFRSELAKSLNNLSNCLSGLGRYEEALVAIEEAMTINRKLAEAWPDAFRSDLVMNLSVLRACLSKLGRHEEASKALEEANSLA